MSDADDPEKKEKDAEEARLRALVRGAQKRRKDEDEVDASKPESEEPELRAKEEEEPSEDETSLIVDDVDLKEALRGALRPPEGAVAPQLLRGVQRKLRVRSKGKFYGDGWSTAESPKTTYLLTSILMLVLIALIFVTLIPWSHASLP